MPTLDHTSGVLYGAAYGDALAVPTEFLRDLGQIRARFAPNGPTTLHAGRVTDDTQMMLAVGRALLDTPELTASAAEGPLRREFGAWLHDPENNRAPGVTCLNACRGLEQGKRWQEATVRGSKGCGANMRVQPAAFISDATTRAAYAQFQAALTHGHPTGLAAADLTAQAIRLLLDGAAPADLPAALTEYAHTQREVYHEDWLGDLWTLAQAPSPAEFIARGWDECLGVLQRLEAALKAGVPADADPCDSTGEGWIAEEAFATGLLCFLLTPQDPLESLRRAAVTRGDSDSLACLAGSFAGAYLGAGAFPAGWKEQIEYTGELERQSRAFAEENL